MPEEMSLLQSYAAVIRNAYCTARNRWHLEVENTESDWGRNPIPRYDGGMDSAGRRHRGVWEKIARFVIEKRISPNRFIEAQFRGRSAAPPEPGTLCSEFALRVYAGYEAAEIPTLQRLFRHQKEQLFLETIKFRPLHWPDAQMYSAILQNTQVGMSALFRYCVAVQKGVNEVVDLFRTTASIQYLASPTAYDQVWGELIPEEMRALARLSAAQMAQVPAEAVEHTGPVRHRRALITE